MAARASSARPSDLAAFEALLGIGSPQELPHWKPAPPPARVFCLALGCRNHGMPAKSTFSARITVALTAFEFLVAFLQAFVFAVLTCVYLNDAVHAGHH